MTSLLLCFSIALFMSLVLTPLVRLAAGHLGVHAQPTRDRWHQRPIPLLGGLAIVGGVVATLGATGSLMPLVPLLAGCGLMCALGVADDFGDLGPSTKLVFQCLIAALLVYWLPPAHLTQSPVADVLLSFLWIVGITNALNLLDNIDGLAAGIAAIAGVFYLAVLIPSGATPINCGLAAFVGASLGFLFYNFHPASVFMGDAGSLFLGAFLGGTGLLVAPQLNAQIAWLAAIPVLILLIPIFDVVFVTLTRRLSGRSALVGGTDHTSHRLVALGISERRAVLVLYALTILGGALGLSIRYVEFGYAVILIDLYLMLLLGLGVVLGHVEAGARSGGRDGREARPLVSELTYRYRLYEVFLDVGLIAVAYYAAFRVRFDGTTAEPFLVPFTVSFPIVIGCQLAGLWFVGKYRQVWRSFSSAELVMILKGITLGVFGSVILVVYLYRFERLSRGVFLIDAAVLTFLLVGSRVVIASIDEYLSRQRASGRHVLIYGAGRAGALLTRKLLQDRSPGGMPIGFIDDDPQKRWLKLEGLPVLGAALDLPEILRTRAVSEVIISIEDLPFDRLLSLQDICAARGVPLKRARFAIEDVSLEPAAFDLVGYDR